MRFYVKKNNYNNSVRSQSPIDHHVDDCLHGKKSILKTRRWVDAFVSKRTHFLKLRVHLPE